MSPISSYIINLLLVFFLVFCNAFFVVSEFAIVKIRRTKLEELAQSGNSKAKIALEINEHLNTYLSATQLGITLASLGLGWLGEPAVSRLLEDLLSGFVEINKVLLHSISFGVAFTFITLLHVVLGELVPKSMAIQDTERYAMMVAKPLYAFNKICTPIIWCFDHVSMAILKMMHVEQADENEDAHSEEEIKLIIDASQKGGVIDDTESEIIQNAINFSEICAHEIMIPRQDIKCIYQDDDFEEVMKFVKENKHTRFPLCAEDKDQILGMIHIRDLLESADEPHKDVLKRIVRKIMFVPENKSISEILHEMMRTRRHLAIVVDEYGGTAGLITLEDVLEEIIGEVQDEFDEEEEAVNIEELGDNKYIANAMMRMDELAEFFGINADRLEEDDVETIGGLVVKLLGRIAEVGDTVSFKGLTFTVKEVDGARITQLEIIKNLDEETSLNNEV